MSRTIVIVQARFGSTRLPGKILEPLGDKTVLAHVLERCRAIDGVDEVCCAIPTSADCDLVVAEAEHAGVQIFRGSETDVLDRYFGAAKAAQADIILRVTSDCPLIDPTVCGDVIKLRARKDAAYASNNNPPSWPHGLDCEAFTFEWLARAADQATAVFDREHVCPFIRNHPDAVIANLTSPDPKMAPHRWTLDTPADLAFFQTLWPLIPEGLAGWDYRVPLEIVESQPMITSINTGTQQ